MINNTDFAYFAGYIDGDGCFYIGKTTNKKTKRVRYQAMLVISSTNRNVLKYFVSIHGGSLRLADNRIKHPGQKPQYQMTIKNKKALEITKNIRLYLVEKAPQAYEFISFIEKPHDSTRDINIEFMQKLKHEFQFVYRVHKELFLKESYYEPTIEADFAYLAGFIDAECCLSVSSYRPKNGPNKTYKIYLACNNTKWPVFKWLVHRFGGSLQFVDRKKKNPAHHDQLQWRLSGNALSNILPSIHKYLIHKKPVCEELMKFYATTLSNGGARHTEKFRTNYATIIEERERIIHNIRNLNKKGI